MAQHVVVLPMYCLVAATKRARDMAGCPEGGGRNEGERMEGREERR